MVSFAIANETNTFLNAIFKQGNGQHILDCLEEIDSHAFSIQRIFRGWEQKKYAKKASCSRGQTTIEASYNTTSGARISIRLHDSHGRPAALFTGTDIVVASLPDTVRAGMKDVPLSRLVDLESAARAGYGFETLLDGNITKAVPLLKQTALRRYTSDGLNQKQIVPIDHYRFLQNEFS